MEMAVLAEPELIGLDLWWQWCLYLMWKGWFYECINTPFCPAEESSDRPSFWAPAVILGRQER